MNPIIKKIVRIDESSTPPTVYILCTDRENYDLYEEVYSIDDIDIRGRDEEGNLILHTED